MSIFNIFFIVVGTIYGGVTILAGFLGLKEKKINIWSSLLMISGGMETVISIISSSSLWNYNIYLLAFGLISIHIATINNGFKIHGTINYKHHIIRLIISILLIILYILK